MKRYLTSTQFPNVDVVFSAHSSFFDAVKTDSDTNTPKIQDSEGSCPVLPDDTETENVWVLYSICYSSLLVCLCLIICLFAVYLLDCFLACLFVFYLFVLLNLLNHFV